MYVWHKFEGNRSSGRPEEINLDSLVSRHRRAIVSEMIGCTHGRKLWTNIVTNATWNGL